MSEITETFRDVSIRGVPYRMMLADGGVLFSNKSGISGLTGRYMFIYRNSLWYFDHAEATFGTLALCHLVKMHELLEQLIGRDHTEADGSKFTLVFKESA